ncbi:MAG: ParB/RepB/Spo0J family partition protein [Verrucomicrobia bacterium]|nr:ParB/RepB/Spo0J family partition protein [Verrucomicrobiota bacterium]MDA1065487.1 ParB/RepB/Spo0J family partition protein [Verrucomicrobiota bacterium]
MAKRKTGLGRGLGSLISGGVAKQEPAKKVTKDTITEKNDSVVASNDVPLEAVSANGFLELAISAIEPNPYQPRRDFIEEQLNELAESIRSEGLLQPIVVRKVGKNYQLIAGERRWRACKQLNLKTIPARLVEASDSSSATLSLIENLQREGLNPVEEALGYASLLRDFDLTQEQVGERVGKGRATIANALRLLQLGKEIQGFLRKGHLSTGHAKVLLGVEEPAQRDMLARRIIEDGSSVRETERLARLLKESPGQPAAKVKAARPAGEMGAIKELEDKISKRFKTRASIKHAPKKGRITIEYFGNDDLTRILEEMGVES